MQNYNLINLIVVLYEFFDNEIEMWIYYMYIYIFYRVKNLIIAKRTDYIAYYIFDGIRVLSQCAIDYCNYWQFAKFQR